MKHVFYGMILMTFLSCQEEISFDVDNRSLLVVDGFITDADKVHTIRLATSAAFDSKFDGGLEQPVTNASVSIEDGSGRSVLLAESRQGLYDTPGGFRAVAGETYSLCVTTADGRHYQSTPQLLVASGEMGEVYFEVTSRKVVENGVEIDRQNITFYSDFTFPAYDYYYKWEWDGTYILNTTFFEASDREIGGCPLRPLDVPEFCYVSEEPDGAYINLLNSNLSTSLTHQRVPVLSRVVDRRWNDRYSLRLFQYSISKESYDFWTAAVSQKEQTGSIFDPAPVKITGNVSNVDDSSEDVLGFFGVYGAQERRLFVPAVPSGIIDVCFLPLLMPEAELTLADHCCDCRNFDENRSKAERPDFWID